jgi:hypothetical protein
VRSKNLPAKHGRKWVARHCFGEQHCATTLSHIIWANGVSSASLCTSALKARGCWRGRPPRLHVGMHAWCLHMGSPVLPVCHQTKGEDGATFRPISKACQESGRGVRSCNQRAPPWGARSGIVARAVGGGGREKRLFVCFQQNASFEMKRVQFSHPGCT